MKQQTNIVLIVIVLILLVITGLALFKSLNLNVETTGKVIQNDQDKGFDLSNYCELDTEANTCLPASSCEFQRDSEGQKICLGKYKA